MALGCGRAGRDAPTRPEPGSIRGGIVTAVEPQPTSRGRRVNLFLDHQFAFGLGTELAVGLHVGRVLDVAEARALLERDLYQRAFDLALRFLGYRPRSDREVRDRLARAGYAEATSEAVLDRLRELKLLDDSAFAAYWLQQRQGRRPRGERLLRQELQQKGLDRDTVSAALASGDADGDAAVRAGLRRAEQLRQYEPREFRARLGAYLARRGFGWDVITPALRRLWEETRGPASAPDAR